MDFTPQRGAVFLLTAMLCVTCVARGQTGGGSVRMSGVVSETVSLSISQPSEAPGLLVDTTRNADGSVTVVVNGSARDPQEIRVPVLIRSNSAYRLFASAEARGADLSSLLVDGARATGSSVAPDAGDLHVSTTLLDHPNLSARTELFGGPRVSLGGTLQSPHNALEVILTLSVEPRAEGRDWTVELLLSAEPHA
ncbi:MAG: hypothetical protein JOZ96_17325 [Acidobacteria bacterium]|nr:hypothetical protein [Acidobacteriota bacterium]